MTGQSQFLTTPVPARPLAFNLSLDDPSYGDDNDLGAAQRLSDSDDRFMAMVASSARLKLNDYDHDDHDTNDTDSVLNDASLSEDAKREALQGIFSMCCSNGQTGRVRSFLDESSALRRYIDLDKPDAEGTPPLIYASCFGHAEVVSLLLNAGANTNQQDKNQWSPLMWAMTNRHKSIAKLLLDAGADPDVKSSTGRTAHDFMAVNSEMSEYLHESGYSIGNAGMVEGGGSGSVGGSDFYNAGMAEDRFEEELAENEMRRRMMMESAINLEVDLGNLGLDEQPEVSPPFIPPFILHSTQPNGHTANTRCICTVPRRQRRLPRIHLGPLPARSNVRLPRTRAPAHPRHRNNTHDTLAFPISKTRPRKYNLPLRSLRALLPIRRPPLSPARNSHGQDKRYRRGETVGYDTLGILDVELHTPASLLEKRWGIEREHTAIPTPTRRTHQRNLHPHHPRRRKTHGQSP